MGKLLVVIGLAVAVAGALLWATALLPESWRPFRLPGDIRIEREGFRLYLPITTMVLISVLLTAIGTLIRWWRG